MVIAIENAIKRWNQSWMVVWASLRFRLGRTVLAGGDGRPLTPRWLRRAATGPKGAMKMEQLQAFDEGTCGTSDLTDVLGSPCRQRRLSQQC